MKKFILFSCVIFFSYISYSQTLPVFERGQKIIHSSFGLSPDNYCFDFSYSFIVFNDIFKVENLNLGFSETAGMLFSKDFSKYGFQIDTYVSLHYTIMDNFALMFQAGLTLDGYYSKIFGLVYNVGAEYLLTERMGLFLKASYLEFYKVNGGLFLIL